MPKIYDIDGFKAAFAWSFSRIELFEKCPLKYRKTNIEKFKDPESPAMQRGKEIARASELYLKSPIGDFDIDQTAPSAVEPDIHPGLRTFAKEFKYLRKMGANAEERWAYDDQWRMVPDYFGDNVWLRINTDIWVVGPKSVDVIDIKTGREYPSHKEQLKLYALGVMLKLDIPARAKIRTFDWYVDTGNRNMLEFTGSARKALIREWESRVRPLQQAYETASFEPKPGPDCKWCPHAVDKGGSCVYTSRGLKSL